MPRPDCANHFEALERRALLSNGAVVQATPPPVVLKVYLGGTAWTPAFKQYIAQNGYDSAVHGAWIGPPSTEGATSPWSNVNQVTIQFSTDMVVASRHLRVLGAVVGEYPIASFAYHLETFNYTGIATWTLARPLEADNLLLDLDADMPGGVRQPHTNTALDGDRNGQPGGDLRLRFASLPGDRNGDERVMAGDLRSVRSLMGTGVMNRGSPPAFYGAGSDINADGRINSQDLAEVRRRLGTSLPQSEPTGVFAVQSNTASRTRPVTRGLFSSTPVLP